MADAYSKHNDDSRGGVPFGSNDRIDEEVGIPIVQAKPVVTTVLKKVLILIVDDVPMNNPAEIQHMKNMGYDVVTTASTSSAMVLLQNGVNPDIIISDMARREDNVDTGDHYQYNATAGLLLLEKIRQQMGPRLTTLPFIIYTTADNVYRYRQGTTRLGGNAIVCRSKDLYQAVSEALPVTPAFVVD